MATMRFILRQVNAVRCQAVVSDQHIQCDNVSRDAYINVARRVTIRTTIRFKLQDSSFVTLKALDVLGNEVAYLVNEHLASTNYEVKFNASSLASGVYYYKFTAGGLSLIKRMILLR
jgi:hypothetical protein